jgi:hypothetical protein
MDHMHLSKILVLLSMLITVLSLPISAHDYNAVDEWGVRLFSAVPDVGVHPRVLMSPEDLTPWRASVVKTYRGRSFFANRYSSPLIDKLTRIDARCQGKELLDAYPHTDPGSNHHLLFATLDVIFHQDTVQAETLCRAVANFARVILARSQFDPKWGKATQDIGDITGLNGIAAGLGHLWYRGGSDFALAYDYLYPYMSEAQRGVCRKALSAATKDLVTWGMGFPGGRAVSNWYAYHGELGPMLLAIEGEEGFRAEAWEMFRTAMRNWVEVQIYDTGGANEDGYVGNLALREGQFTLIAMARRGENLYRTPALQNYWKWAVLSLVPGEDTGRTVGYSSACLDPYESSPVLARWAMPGNPYLNYYLRQFKGQDYRRNNRWQYAQMSTLFCMNWEDTADLPLQIKQLDLPLSAVFDYQGLFITRSDWSEDACYLNMLARHDAWYDRHENVDRGRFVFAALGRRWAVDRPWGQYMPSTDHSLVHIDGLAQAEAQVGRGKAPNAQLLSHGDVGRRAPVLSYAVMDLSSAYNWLWAHSWQKPGPDWEPESRSFAELGWPWQRPGQPPALHGHDRRDCPQYNFRGCHLWRKPNNPVKYCWRTGVLARGEHPYAIIVDDVKKDAKAHTYDWYMPLPDDLEFVPLDMAPTGTCLLVEKDEQQHDKRPVLGSRRLLIMPLGPGTAQVRLEEYAASYARGQAQKARRLVVSRRVVEGRFRVLLYPFHTSIDPRTKEANTLFGQHPLGVVLPELDQTSTGMRMKIGGEHSEWTFVPGKDGRSRIRLQRGSQTWDINP